MILFAVFLLSCQDYQTDKTPQPKTPQPKTPQPKIQTHSTTAKLLEYSIEVLQTIKDKDYDKLSSYFSPNGVRFSPYGYIEATDMKLTAVQFLDHIKTDKKLLWGYYDGKGGEIRLSIENYFTKFVYDVDFIVAPYIEANKVVARGNTINNIDKFYTDHEFVEYHFEGFDPTYSGMDWRSLMLVFRTIDGKLYLEAIIHDMWTI